MSVFMHRLDSLIKPIMNRLDERQRGLVKQRVDHTMALIGGMDPELRADAGTSAILARQLEFIYAQTYDVKYPEYKARLFIPVDSSVPTGAETYTYRQWDGVGMAKMISDYADDLPRVDVTAQEFTGKCESLGDSYGYSIQELRASSMANAQIDSRRANWARRAVESKIDALAAFGDSALGLPGFVNNANVPLATLPNGSWASATPQEILEDLRYLQDQIVVTTKQTFAPNTLLLDTQSFATISGRELDPANNTTILEQFMRTSPYIKNVDQWHKLDEADVAGTGPRIIMYDRNPDVVQQIIPQEFEQFPPEARNMAFVINCHARHGGVSWRYPLAAQYADGV